MAVSIFCVAPSPMATVQMTAATPMITPSIVSAVLILLRPRARNAIRKVEVNSTISSSYRTATARRNLLDERNYLRHAQTHFPTIYTDFTGFEGEVFPAWNYAKSGVLIR
jgi:hypothetical protein